MSKNLGDRLYEVGAIRRKEPAFFKDDPQTWVNAPLTVVLEEAKRVLPTARELAQAMVDSAPDQIDPTDPEWDWYLRDAEEVLALVRERIGGEA